MSKDSVASIIQELSKDLENIDTSIISPYIEAAEKSVSNKDEFEKNMNLISKICADKTFIDVQWHLLGGRVLAYLIKQQVRPTFSLAMEEMSRLLEPNFYSFVVKNAKELDEMIVSERDMEMDIFAISTVKNSHLGKFRRNGKIKICETPQYMYLRVATFIWFENDSQIIENSLSKIRQMYNSMSLGEYSHASPTLFNAGFKKHQMASCFLQSVRDDMVGIANSWRNAAIISKHSGGLGFDYSNLRHSEIGESGQSRGICPWLKIKDEILNGVDQGGKRKGSGTIFLKDWHIDIRDFVSMREEGPLSAPDLFYAVAISDLFMERVLANKMWTLFCPNLAKGLADVYGQDFKELYESYEKDLEIPHKTILARDLFDHIINIQIKKGMPFICYIDSINKKNNQKHDGLVRCLNLCMEVAENTGVNADGQEEIASCNLGAVALNSCVTNITVQELITNSDRYFVNQNSLVFKNGNVPETIPAFDFFKLRSIVKELVENINQVIDRNYYPDEIPEIKYANLRNRPIAIGVQGQADAIAMLDMAWVKRKDHVEEKYKDNWAAHFEIDPMAKMFNSQLYENMYYAALNASADLAKIHGPYDSFYGSEASKGILQFHMWENGEQNLTLNWGPIIEKVKTFGIRNSLLLSLMPTATSAQVCGNNECFEPFNQMFYTRTVLSGQFILINKHMLKDLQDISSWNSHVAKDIMSNNGSVQNIDISLIPVEHRERFEFLKLKYRTIFEIPQTILSEMCQDRGKFICQTQSFNSHIDKPTRNKLYSFHMDAWKRGLKTGMYYCRQPSVVIAQNFSVDALSMIDSKPTGFSSNHTALSKKSISYDSKKESISYDSKKSSPKRKIVCNETVCTSCAL